MKQIKLKNSKKYVLVDEKDYLLFKCFKWYLVNGYASLSHPKNGVVTLHRMIMKAKKGQEVDHINGNRLDNTRSNLRFVTRSQNIQNSRLRKTGMSGYRGVCYHYGKWQTTIRFQKKTITVGTFQSKLQAAKAYNTAAVKYYGSHAFINSIYPC